jgi:hypothetical protein
VQCHKKRAPRVKGAAPLRKSCRSSKAAHADLSEKNLSGEGPPERLRYRLSRKRFETESMPPKRKRQHDFDESYEFKNDATYSAAVEWFTILKLQPELAAADWDAICENMAFNLGQESVTKDSLAGGTGETADLIYDTALYDIEEVPLGTKLALKRVLLDLRTGMYIGLALMLVLMYKWCHRLTTPLSCTGEAAACLSATDRRHGDGQRIASATFRQFLLNSVKEYGDDARKGIKHFRLDNKRAQVMAAICLTIDSACMCSHGAFFCATATRADAH